MTANCLKCHGPEKQKGGLRFDSRDGLLAKGDSGSVAVSPGKSASSELLQRITSKDATLQMPPGDKRLNDDQIASIRKWIDAGAEWSHSKIENSRSSIEMKVTAEDRQFWSFRPLTKNPTNTATIDPFLLAKLKAKGLTYSPPATREQLIRRVVYDMTGLPPTPKEVERFVTSPNLESAYIALVDRLLTSPEYGERWGRHWLDVARYADSDGYESDADRPNAFHYRDFVIQSLNDDMPFDLFVRKQLAGDEITPDDAKSLSATGFLAAGPAASLPDRLLEEERNRQRYIELDDMVATTGTAFLGLTIGCARCHDHKFDPLPTRDYYRILAALHSGDRADMPLGTRKEVETNQRLRAEWQDRLNAAESSLKTWLDPVKKKYIAKLRDEKIDRLTIGKSKKQLLKDKADSPEAKALAKKHEKDLAISDAELRKVMDDSEQQTWDGYTKVLKAVRMEEPKALPKALGFRDADAKPKASWLFRRGDFHDREIPVELGFVTILTGEKSAAEYWNEARAKGSRTDSTHQRLALAEWLTDANHGAGALLARVIVNRVWQHHFGDGIVRTPNDFGLRGDRPSHPELLEWLASDFVSHGWKLKRLHRMILLSDAYRQGNTTDEKILAADPENRLLSRMRPRRMEAEALRDAMLSVSGTLNEKMYGPAFKPMIPAEAMVARNLKSAYPKDIADSPDIRRRSVYMFHKRVVPYPLFQAYDTPDAQQCTGRRNVTTVAPQALALLNDPFVRSLAEDFAIRLLRDAGQEPAKLIEQAYRLAFGRSPTALQKEAGIEFLAKQNADRKARDPKAPADEIRILALTDYCQALFGLNEFIYVD